MKEGQNIGVAIPNNVISQNPIADTIVVDVYDAYGKKLIEELCRQIQSLDWHTFR
jgi:hypothetical protein